MVESRIGQMSNLLYPVSGTDDILHCTNDWGSIRLVGVCFVQSRICRVANVLRPRGGTGISLHCVTA
jgi:hypothetical protein